MEFDKYVIQAATAAALAAAAVTGVTTYLLMRNKGDGEEEQPKAKYRRVDVAAFKRSMSERYKQLDLVKVDEDAKATLIKGVHTNIDKDIHNLFSEAEYVELLAHNEMLYSKHS